MNIHRISYPEFLQVVARWQAVADLTGWFRVKASEGVAGNGFYLRVMCQQCQTVGIEMTRTLLFGVEMEEEFWHLPLRLMWSRHQCPHAKALQGDHLSKETLEVAMGLALLSLKLPWESLHA